MDGRSLAAMKKTKKEMEKRGSFVKWHSCRQYKDGYTLERFIMSLEPATK